MTSLVWNESKSFWKSSKWRCFWLVLSFVYLYAFVLSRIIEKQIHEIITYVFIHLYQLSGYLIAILFIEWQDYFLERFRCVEYAFIPFILTPYSLVRWILGTMSMEYRDPNDSPFLFLIGVVFVPTAGLIFICFFMDGKRDTLFYPQLAIFAILLFYVTCDIINNLKYRSRRLIYFSLITWTTAPVVLLWTEIYILAKGEQAILRKREANNRNRRNRQEINPVEQHLAYGIQQIENFVIGDEGRFL